jgi:hypothetical protein
MIQAKFGLNWPSGFRGEDFLKSLQTDDGRQVMAIAHTGKLKMYHVLKTKVHLRDSLLYNLNSTWLQNHSSFGINFFLKETIRATVLQQKFHCNISSCIIPLNRFESACLFTYHRRHKMDFLATVFTRS